MEHLQPDGDRRHRFGPPPRRERGATAVEYGLLIALIAAVIIASVQMLGSTVEGLFDSVTWW